MNPHHGSGATKRSSLVPRAIFLLALAALAVTLAVYGRQYPLSIHSVFDDVISYGRFARLVGFVSDLGIVLWLSAAVLIMHGWHRRLNDTGVPVTAHETEFYLGLGLFLLFMGLDDRLLIHEWLTDRWGIAEWLVMTVYGAVTLIGGIAFRRYLVQGPLHWLWMALVLLALSVAMELQLHGAWLDQLMSPMHQEVLEESAKWLGICSLFLYIFRLMTHPPVAVRNAA